MSNFVPFDRDQAFLMPADLKAWLPGDDLAHFVVAVERVRLAALHRAGAQRREAAVPPASDAGAADLLLCQWHLLVRRIERATYRDIAVRFVAANLHPDHDTIAVFRRINQAAFQAAFLQVLLLARESGLLRLGTVSIDGTKIDANASKIRSVRYDRAQDLRAKLAADIAALTAQAEAADATDHDPQGLPAELARREALKAKPGCGV